MESGSFPPPALPRPVEESRPGALALQPGSMTGNEAIIHKSRHRARHKMRKPQFPICGQNALARHYVLCLNARMDIQSYRKHHGLSVGKLAERLDLNKRTVISYLYRERRPSWQTQRRIFARTNGEITPDDWFQMLTRADQMAENG